MKVAKELESEFDREDVLTKIHLFDASYPMVWSLTKAFRFQDLKGNSKQRWNFQIGKNIHIFLFSSNVFPVSQF